jgi:integrase
MSDYQQLQTTNYLSPFLFYNKFLFWLIRLQPFINETGRPPMNADSFVRAFRIQYGCGLRISEVLNLKKKDIDLNHRLLTIAKPKTGHRKKFRTDGTIIDNIKTQRTTILPYDIDMLEKQLDQVSDNDKIFNANRHVMWQYAKDAGNLAGLPIGEIQDEKTIDGIWTHLMRKSCSKRMRDMGASRELAMVKLRHVNKDAHDAYDRKDINALLEWESQNFQMVSSK